MTVILKTSCGCNVQSISASFSSKWLEPREKCVIIFCLLLHHFYFYRAITYLTLQRGPATARELYIVQSSCPFSPSRFTLFPSIDISSYYFYSFSRNRQTHCKIPRVKMSNIVIFMRLWKWPKLDLGCVSFFFFFLFSSHFNSPHF